MGTTAGAIPPATREVEITAVIQVEYNTVAAVVADEVAVTVVAAQISRNVDVRHLRIMFPRVADSVGTRGVLKRTAQIL